MKLVNSQLAKTLRIAVAILVTMLLPKAVFSQQADGADKTFVDFAKDVAPILQARCASCHEGEKARNGFVVSDRSAVLAFIEPGKANESSLWNDYLVQPSKQNQADSLVMPPNGPLSQGELAILKIWIDEGAKWPEGTSIGTLKSDEPPKASTTTLSKWFLAVGYFHPAIVHFPIVLFMLSGCMAFLSCFLGGRTRNAAFQLLVLATVSSMLSAVFGWSFAITQGYPDWSNTLAENATELERSFFLHRWLGTITPLLGCIVVAMGLFERRFKSRALANAWLFSTVLLMFLVGMVGHQGGELVYGDIFEKAYEQITK